MHNQRPISLSNIIGEQVKIKKTLGAFKNALKYIYTNRIDRQSANHDDQLKKASLSTSS